MGRVSKASTLKAQKNAKSPTRRTATKSAKKTKAPTSDVPQPAPNYPSNEYGGLVIFFTQLQRDALVTLADARPKYWEYRAKAILNDMHGKKDFELTMQFVQDAMNEWLVWRIELPEEHSIPLYLTQYDKQSGATAGWTTIDPSNGKSLRKPLHHIGRDLLEWIHSAYANLELFINAGNEILARCREASTGKIQGKLFDIPPLPPEDKRITALRPYEKYFQAMSAASILNVFDTRKGRLFMSSGIRTESAYVLEGVRVGLGLEPRHLAQVTVQMYDRKVYKWKDKDGRNAIGTLKSSATKRSAVKYKEQVGDLHDTRDALRLAIVAALKAAAKG